MNDKKIIFIPKSIDAEHLVPPPKPAKNYEPDWWKNIPAFANGGKPIIKDGEADRTVKLCTPFADTFRFGYIQEAWCDIHISTVKTLHKTNVEYNFSSFPDIMDLRKVSDVAQKASSEYHPMEFAWQTQWAPKVPKGYSVLITHPLNREELPFTTMTGIVDADKYFFEKEGNHPFFIKKDFEGIIPKGTPLFQIIPFKRDNWKSEVGKYTLENAYKAVLQSQYFWGAYKKLFWSKKTFK